MKIASEKELCEKFIEAHPRREHLYYEVHVPGGRCDIVHMEHLVVTIYEAKLRLSIELLEQCINRKPYAHMVYAIVPEARRINNFLKTLFEDYGIGIISFRHNHTITDVDTSGRRSYRSVDVLREYAHPKLNRHPHKITLYKENKKEIAGSQQGGITPFGIMVRDIKETLAHHKTRTIDELFKSQTYYGSLKQFKTNMYQWIRVGVIKGIYMEKGVMGICETEELKSA